MEDALLNTMAVAELTGYSASTISDFRREEGRGPPFKRITTKYGSQVRYARADVLAWLKDNPPKVPKKGPKTKDVR